MSETETEIKGTQCVRTPRNRECVTLLQLNGREKGWPRHLVLGWEFDPDAAPDLALWPDVAGDAIEHAKYVKIMIGADVVHVLCDHPVGNDEKNGLLLALRAGVGVEITAYGARYRPTALPGTTYIIALAVEPA